MHFFPSLLESKRHKKTSSFVNPLTSAFYNNANYLENSKIPSKKESSFRLTDLMKTRQTIQNDEQINNQKTQRQKKFSLNKQYTKKISRQIVAINATSRLAELSHKGQNFLLLNSRCLRAFKDNDNDLILSRNKLNNGNILNNYTHLANTQDKGPIIDRKQRLKDHLVNNYKTLEVKSQSKQVFQKIQILVLDVLQSFQDISIINIKINLKRYFLSFFKQQLSGIFTEDFLNKVEKYYKIIEKYHRFDQKISEALLNQEKELFKIRSKLEFLTKIQELQNKMTKWNQQRIIQMIKYYCIPEKQLRQSGFRDIILMLTQQVTQTFNLSKENQYILMDENGNEITQIISIKFSTSKLFISSKENATTNYQKYIKLTEKHINQRKLINFNEQIKTSFRKSISKGHFDPTLINYSQNVEQQSIKRKNQLIHAQKLLKQRNQTSRINKFAPRQQIIYYERSISNEKSLKLQQKNSLNSIKQSQSKYSDMKCSNTQKKKQTILPSLYWKIQSNRINSTQPWVMRSISQPKNYSRKSSVNNSRIFNEKQQPQNNLFSFGNSALNIQQHKLIESQFFKLIQQNDSIDFSFNHTYKDQILTKVVKQWIKPLKQKTSQQFERIINSIKKIVIQTDQDEVNQHKTPKQTLNKSLSLKEFVFLNILMNNIDAQDIITKFLCNYLHFNQYRSYSKGQLLTDINFILGNKTQNSILQILVQVIWTWLQSNSVVQHENIEIKKLENQFYKYKVFYKLMVSLIFGTNHTTALDLAYQLLVL